MKYWLHLLKGAVIAEACGGQDISGIGFKVIADVFWNMSITSDGDDLTTQLLIELQNRWMRMRISHVFIQASGIDLDSFSMFNDRFQNSFKDICIIRKAKAASPDGQ